YPVVSIVGLFAAMLTAYYMARLTLTTFFGAPRWQASSLSHEHAHQGGPPVRDVGHEHTHAQEAHGHGHGGPHESPWVMTVPLVVLAFLSIVGGIWLSGSWEPQMETWIGQFLAPSFHWAATPAEVAGHGVSAWAMAGISFALAVAGILWGAALFRNGTF